MFLHRYSLKKLLLYTSFGIVAVLVIIALTTNFSIDRSIRNYTTLSKMDELTECALRLRKYERDFVMVDIKSPQFYQEGQSRNVVLFDSTLKQTKILLEGLKRQGVFNSDKLSADLAHMESALQDYSKSFYEMVALRRTIGFKDEGVIGKMRTAIHQVENELKSASSFELISQMLMLRRHEKDYMLRKDTTYVRQFSDQMKVMAAKVGSPTMVGLLNTYKSYFDEYVALDRQVGVDDNSGVNAQITKSASLFETAVANARMLVNDKEHSSTNSSLFVLFAIILLLSGLVTIILYLTSNHILKTIGQLQSYIVRLGRGELPEKVVVQGRDEIAQMEGSLNELIAALSNTRDFAIEVGNGNFEADINVFGNTGEVGESLQEMRKKLSQVALERQQQVEENRRRLWINEGVALVNDIVNKSKDNMEELCYSFISGIVKYSGVNQAGLMLEEVDESKQSYLHMVAAFAYDRRKLYKKRIEIGDGLAGMCFWEKEMIFMTDVPKEYSSISSALGEASPRCIIILPLLVDDSAIGVLEMASFKIIEPVEIEFFEKSVGILAARLLALRTSIETAKLLEQTKIQAQEMAAQDEEMRQNLEELQSTQESIVKREEEIRLEMQQVQRLLEQERTNAERERSGYLAKVEAQGRTIDALGATFLLAELSLEGDLLWANGRFRSIFQVDNALGSFNYLGSRLIIDKQLEDTRWSRLRDGESYVGSIELLLNGGVSTLQVSYQVIGSRDKGRTILFSGVIVSSPKGVLEPMLENSLSS